MDQHPSKVILTQMIQKKRPSWPQKQKLSDKRLLRNTAFFAAVSLCLGVCALVAVTEPQMTKEVMSHLTTDFEYDETLGRLQLVSNMLPESAMVFLSTDTSAAVFQMPVRSEVSHSWSQQEPWMEYACIGDVSTCQAGEVITIVKNHTGSHTLRILHDHGYESIYSGLSSVHVKEHETVSSGQIIGTAAGNAAFELRRDGVSVLPVFSEL